MLTMYLSFRHVSDFAMLVFGNVIFAVGGVLTYLWWRADTGTVVQFATTLVLLMFGYPFMGPANRSAYTRAIHSRPDLADSLGVLQGLLVQAFTIGGIVGPLFVTKFILREPQEVDSSRDPHELTQWAWLVPTFSMLIITGLLYEEFILGSKSQPETVDEAVDETSKLVAKKQQDRRRSSIAEINQAFSPEYEVNRRVSSETNALSNGIICSSNPVETAYETELRDEMLNDKKEWEDIMKEAGEDIEMME